jgi:hypothetical protein
MSSEIRVIGLRPAALIEQGEEHVEDEERCLCVVEYPPQISVAGPLRIRYRAPKTECPVHDDLTEASDEY